MSESVSRRSFVKASAGAVGMAAIAGATQTPAFADESAEGQALSFDEEFDIVIVGAGIAGTAAAVTVGLEGNGATCLLLEKGDAPGGCSPFCGGGAICTDDAESIIPYLRDLAGEFPPSDEIIQAYAEGFAENYQWFQTFAPQECLDLTVPMSDASIEYPEFGTGQGVMNHLHVLNPENPDDNSYTHRLLLSQVESLSDVVTYRTSTPATGLIQDSQSGAIVGVETDGARIGARMGVILACGGFENDPEMLQCYLQSGSAVSSAAQLNTGDGIKMCMALGARMWHMSTWAGAWMAPRNLDNTMFVGNALAVARDRIKAHGITVAVNGRRFYMDFDGHNVEDEEYDANYPNMSQHVGFRHGHTQFGGEWPNLPMPPHGWYVFDANGLAAGAMGSTFDGDVVADGWGYSAETIEELAEQMGVPTDELTATVEQWNGYCEAGEDLAFHRPTSTLAAIDTPPYYAVPCVPTFLNTDGGPERNERCQVLSMDGTPIAGLYEAGEMGSFWGHYYQGAGNVGECLLSARIAVRNILAS